MHLLVSCTTSLMLAETAAEVKLGREPWHRPSSADRSLNFDLMFAHCASTPPISATKLGERRRTANGPTTMYSGYAMSRNPFSQHYLGRQPGIPSMGF